MTDSATLVSACLLGVNCRYDGQNRSTIRLPEGAIIPACPEVTAGMGVPRPAIERDERGRIYEVKSGADVTERLAQACDTLVNRAVSLGVQHAVLKERSPSCGSTQLWRNGKLVPGEGLFTEKLRASGVLVTNETGDTH